MSILGNRVTRSEDPRFITGSATFGEDVELQGAVHVTFVRSILPHARIRSIDTSGVGLIPGAQAFTAVGLPSAEGAAGTDIDLPTLPHAMPGLNEQMVRPVIASDTVRYAGEPLDSWGALVEYGRNALGGDGQRWWLLVCPAAAMSLTLFSMNFLGDGLRDALDPQQRGRR